jgi:hypothetical protein
VEACVRREAGIFQGILGCFTGIVEGYLKKGGFHEQTYNVIFDPVHTCFAVYSVPGKR